MMIDNRYNKQIHDVCIQVCAGMYECSYTPCDVGRLSVNVIYNGRHVAQSPYQVDIIQSDNMPLNDAAMLTRQTSDNGQTSDQPDSLGTFCVLSSSSVLFVDM